MPGFTLNALTAAGPYDAVGQGTALIPFKVFAFLGVCLIKCLPY